jgi:O-methyltransferase involved in polyketide biosynthesis
MTTEHAPDHQKISFTAKLVALGRSATTIPFARDVSVLVGAPALAEDLARSAGTAPMMPPLMVPFIEARYMSLVSAIKRSGVRQVVEFASGVSLRGLAMTLEDPELTYVETDLGELTDEKRRIMAEILARRQLVAPRKHHVATANILVWDEIEAALAPLDPAEPVAVVHEGLFMYLSQAEKETAARHIGRILDRFGGVWITPDFGSMADQRWTVEGGEEHYDKVLAVVEARTGRSFMAHSFASEQAACAFCERFGFSVEERPQLDGSYELSSLPEGLSAEAMGRIRQGLKLWEMRR